MDDVELEWTYIYIHCTPQTALVSGDSTVDSWEDVLCVGRHISRNVCLLVFMILTHECISTEKNSRWLLYMQLCILNVRRHGHLLYY